MSVYILCNETYTSVEYLSGAFKMSFFYNLFLLFIHLKSWLNTQSNVRIGENNMFLLIFILHAPYILACIAARSFTPLM